jgi:hypothetical protein
MFPSDAECRDFSLTQMRGPLFRREPDNGAQCSSPLSRALARPLSPCGRGLPAAILRSKSHGGKGEGCFLFDAASPLTPHRAPSGARALPQGESGELAAPSWAQGMQSPCRDALAPGFWGERRAEKRKPMVSAILTDHGGRLSARHTRRWSAAGPALRCRRNAGRSASSWQGFVVSPEGAPSRPEALACEPDPQAPHLIPPARRLATAPLNG